MSKQPGSWCVLVLLVWMCASGATLAAQGPNPAELRYTVSLEAYQDRLVHVQMELPPGAPTRRIELPVWNALYQVRDFAQYITWVRAKGTSGALEIKSLDKSSWEVEGTQDGATLGYEIAAALPGPYGAHLSASHAFFNFAEILMYLPDARDAKTRVRFVNVPAGWKFATALAAEGDSFTAENYDRLVDSPVEIGTFKEVDLTKVAVTIA
jgi:predicted metalloprotease with PDZ domain